MYFSLSVMVRLPAYQNVCQISNTCKIMYSNLRRMNSCYTYFQPQRFFKKQYTVSSTAITNRNTLTFILL